MREDIGFAGKAGDAISTKIAKRSTATSTGTFWAQAAEGNSVLFPYYVTSTAATYVWNDRSGAGATHTYVTSDWSQDYKIAGLPTATLTLSK